MKNMPMRQLKRYAAILWHDLALGCGDTQWNEYIKRALNFCRSVQFNRASDNNLQGAILEIEANCKHAYTVIKRVASAMMNTNEESK